MDRQLKEFLNGERAQRYFAFVREQYFGRDPAHDLPATSEQRVTADGIDHIFHGTASDAMTDTPQKKILELPTSQAMIQEQKIKELEAEVATLKASWWARFKTWASGVS